jgi:hypothetical protein
MSHYSVAVILPKTVKQGEIVYEVDKVLSPFDENLEVNAYQSYTKEQVNEIFLEQKKRGIFTDEEYDKFLDDFFGKENVDDKGGIISTYNPNSKWDWYEIGGRWNNSITTKDLKKVNYTRIKDIEFEAMLSKKELDELKKYYNRLIKGEEGYSPEYVKKKYPTFESYLKVQDFSTYAILDSNGNWHESGRMGWFGCSSATPEEEIEFSNKYRSLIEKEDLDNWLVVVDCHI